MVKLFAYVSLAVYYEAINNYYIITKSIIHSAIYEIVPVIFIVILSRQGNLNKCVMDGTSTIFSMEVINTHEKKTCCVCFFKAFLGQFSVQTQNCCKTEHFRKKIILSMFFIMSVYLQQ